MEVQQIYTENKNNLLFSRNSKIKKLREKILKKITKDYLNKKNNESIKNVDLNLLNSLDYKYKKIKVLNSIKINNQNNYELNLIPDTINHLNTKWTTKSYESDNLSSRTRYQNERSNTWQTKASDRSKW